MNRLHQKNARIFKVALLSLLLLLTVFGISACKQASPLTVDHITSVKVNEEGTVLNVKAELSAQTLQAHQGEQVLLFALMPDELSADLASIAPIAKCDVQRSPSFEITLDGSNVTSLYAAYVIATEDGTLLNEATHYVSNLSSIAQNKRELLWAQAQKGLVFDDASSAASLGCMLGMTEVRLSALLGAEGIGADVAASLNKQALLALDKAIADAAGNTMQASLHLSFDRRISFSQCAALMEFLISRYNAQPEYNLASFYISTDASYTAKETASLAHIASMSLSRHGSAGQVYIVCSARTLTAQRVFFSEIFSQVDKLGDFPWGAAVVPTLPEKLTLWEADAQIKQEEADKDGEKSDLMLPSRIGVLINQFKALDGTPPSSVVLFDLKLPYENEEQRAASYAYAYTTAIAQGADAVYYGAHWDDSEGVLDDNGAPNKMTSVFSSIDIGLAPEQSYLCSSVVGELWQTLPTLTPTRKTVSGSASLQKPHGDLSTLVDFSGNDINGFSVFGKAEEPTVRNSAAWSAPVLSTWMYQPTKYSGAGVGCTFDSSADIKNTLSLSARVLLQGTADQSPILRLRLWGTDRTGKLLSYSAEQALPSGTWQTATFSVASFFSELDTNRPFSLTLEVLGTAAVLSNPSLDGDDGDTAQDSDTPERAPDEAFVFWMKDILLRRPEASNSKLVPTLLTVGGVVGVFALTVCIYYLVTSRRRRQ